MYPKTFFSKRSPAIEPQTCFVMMPFADEFHPVYEAIRQAVEGSDLSYSCTRADELFGGGHIMADILRWIARAEVIIADVTKRNPNVFYELGIAHTVKPIETVMIITQSMEDVPFDLRHLRCTVYKSIALDDLQRQIIESIREVTPAGLRFAVQEGETFTFRRRLPGPDRYLYDFDLGPVYIGVNFAKFGMTVRRLAIGATAETVWSDTHGIRSGESVEIPFARWKLNLDRVGKEKAHFCLCEPEAFVE